MNVQTIYGVDGKPLTVVAPDIAQAAWYMKPVIVPGYGPAYKVEVDLDFTPPPLAIPDQWSEALYNIRWKACDTAVIAGGCLRDLDNGRPVKDIDIFVTHDTKMSRVKDALKKNVADWKRAVEYGHIEVKEPKGRRGRVAEAIEAPGGFPVNVIRLRPDLPTAQSWREHDFGICQIAYDGNIVESTEYYTYDKENETFGLRYCPSYEVFCQSMKRFQRIHEKYPTWKLELCVVGDGTYTAW